MIELTRAAWNKYVKQLGQIDQRAGQLMADYIQQVGTADTQRLIRFAAALVNKYGAASSALAARFYDEMAQASGLTLPAAEPAEVSSYGEVAKAVNGTRDSIANTRNAVSRMVKQAGADTILKNAKRDGAEFAWVPNGDSCAFCITLASRGWQKASKAAIKGNHAEHIHANCDCNYCIRFNSKTTVEGYDPDSYLEMYESAEGGTPQEKINAMRRQIRQGNREKVNRQKREAYAARKGLTSDRKGGTLTTRKQAEYIGKPIIERDNQHVREWYVANVSDIPNQIDTTKPLEDQARQAYELRNQYKHAAREAMSDTETAQRLDQERPAPTFDELLERKIRQKGMTRDEAVRDILKTASKTNRDVNKEFGL